MPMLRRVKLIYPAHLVDRPILYEMIKRFDIVTNIRAANITAEAGWLVVELSGESAQLEAALAWVMEQGVQVEWLTSPA